MMKFLQQHSLYFAWLIAAVGMLATLYGSEIMHLPVCNLCWYQRICLYPLVVILGIACYKNTHDIVSYVLPLPILGMFFSGYQYAEQMIPGFGPIPLCGEGIPCGDIHFQLFGFITLPFLSLLAFIGLTGLLILSTRR
jgi:disulfide bond formation protein DsbB